MAAFPLTVDLGPDHLQLKPGASASVAVLVTNVSDIVEHYQVTLVGLPSHESWTAEPAVVKLRPRESATIDLRITIPERGGLLGGRYPLGVLVTSPYQPDVSRSADLVLDVGAVSGITLSATPSTASGTTSAVYSVSLTNDGNINVPVELRAVDDQGKATIVVTPPSLYVSAGTAQVAQVAVRAPGVLTGQERRSAISIKAVADGETRGETQVSFVQTPRIPAAVLRALGVALAVAVVAGSIVAGAVLGRRSSDGATSGGTGSAGGGSSSASASASAGGKSSATPVAKPTVSAITADPTPVLTGAETTFKAKASGGVQTWKWQVVGSDGTSVTTGDTPKELRYTFTAAGTFTVKLSVADAAGQAATATDLPVTVTEQPPTFTVVRTPLTVQPGQTATNAAACPGDLVVLSGGVAVANAVLTELQSSYGTSGSDSPTQWTVTLRNPTSSPAEAQITAVCAAEPSGYHVKHSSDTSVEPGASADTTLSCPDGLVAIGGGGGIRSDTVTDTQSVLQESTPVQDSSGHWTGWRVRALNNAADAQSLSAQLVCAEEPDGYSVQTAQQTLAAGSGVEQTFAPPCDADLVAVGGGIGATDSIPPGNAVLVRASGATVASDGTGEQEWTSTVSFTGTADQPLVARTVCARFGP